MLYPAELLRLIFIFLLPRKCTVTKLLYLLPTQIASAQGNKTKSGGNTVKCSWFGCLLQCRNKEKVAAIYLPRLFCLVVAERIPPFWNIPRDIWFTCHPIYCANPEQMFATVYKGNIIKNLIMDCQSYTKYRPNETTGGIFVSWRRKEELPTGA